MTEQQQIDQILLEANAWFVRTEVEQYAYFLITEGWGTVQAYQQAYQDIIIFENAGHRSTCSCEFCMP
jgi:hypothetical protein